MSTNFQYRFLNNVNFDELVEVFNKAFHDYVVPMQLTREELEKKIKTEGIQLSDSIGVYANKKLVGFILHGRNNYKLYNAATGVIPEYRGNNLTTKMYEYGLPIFRSFDIRKISLEVISTNDIAFKAYRKIGFKKWRSLNCLKGKTKYKLSQKELLNNIEIKDTSYYEYLVHYAEKDLLPSWQNNEFCISNNERNLILKKAVLDNQLIGYIIFNPANGKIHQIWVKEPYRRKGIGTLLVSHCLPERKEFYITNIDAQNFGLNMFIKSIGGQAFLEQNEMELYLK
ncbi:GNAT family N-acetyltransferase [Myroides pelagicus]|uniref:GNAT family N-acetyltransferase n=1 Tax=Myroides pelagicus TaxID=270914 RepID=A0A7K1GHQ7_9FLAO|nr:GNAT family N-acetyltransferase [Myroides pelagicus]MTH28505.1 GNAT family N-acetyltransferase [Myroides pelagicus]